jgi:hypothetical protein
MKKTIILFISLFLFSHFISAQESTTLETYIEKDYGIDIVWNVHVSDTWGSVTYSNTKENPLVRYLELLRKEMGKYSKAYFDAINLETIVLGSDMAFSGQARAAIPDPYKGVLYYSVNGAYGDASITYLTHTFHHELHHYTEYSIWKSMYFDWSEWGELNIDGFQYGSGGVTAYADPDTDYYTPIHPEKGFMNLYSMTGDEEDRCEIIAFYLTDDEAERAIQLLLEDEILMKKYKLLAELVNNVSGDIILPVNP